MSLNQVDLLNRLIDVRDAARAEKKRRDAARDKGA